MLNNIKYYHCLISLMFITNSVYANNQEEIKVPVQVDHLFMRQVLVTTLFKGKNQKLRVFDDGTGCNFLQLHSPEISTTDGMIRVRADSKARMGRSIGNKKCYILFEWTGKIESYEKLYIDGNRPVLKAKVVRSSLLDENGKTSKGNYLLWSNVNQYLHPKLESVVLDLADVKSVIQSVLPDMLDHDQQSRVKHIVNSLALSDVEINAQGVKVNFAMQLPPERKQKKQQPVKPLTEKEMEKLDLLFREFDSFITIIVKKAAGDTEADELRNALLAVLLDTRHDIVDALQSSHLSGEDPVREIFISAWRELAPVLRNISYKLKGVEPGISYLSFVTATDALMAVDTVGAELGIDISSNGLKRLARILLPQLQDPLLWKDEIDPELRQLFKFSQETANQSRTDHWFLDYFIRSASAQQVIDTSFLNQLNSWVPNKKELDSYLPMVEKLLRHSSEKTLDKSSLQEQFHGIYKSLVLATGWQESCWRQYVKRRGKQEPLKSSVGAVGLMQVVPRVWRGFYTVKKLQWDIAYNIDAGSEILMRYLQRYALRKNEHIKTGNPDNLARATYSAYNAGPRKLTRYRWKSATKRQKRVDQDFYERYMAMKNNKIHKVATCY